MQRDSVDVDHIFMNDEDKKLDSLPRDKSYNDTKHSTVFENRSNIVSLLQHLGGASEA